MINSNKNFINKCEYLHLNKLNYNKNMLSKLVIKNFAIIEDLEVDFPSGFIALTGETGAGKSIIIDALSLLMGERSSFDKIRFNEQKAFIEGVFYIKNDKIKKQIESLIDDNVDEELILSRTLDISGKSQAKINMHNVPLTVLKNVTSLILDIHSQQKDNNYLKEENQLNLLDSFSELLLSKDEKEIFNEFNKSYKDYLETKSKLQNLKNKQLDLGSIDYLKFQDEELNKVNIQENEMENLEQERNSLMNFSKQSEKIAEFLSIYEEVSSSLYKAKKTLSYIDDEDKLSEKFNDLYFQMDDIYQTINDKFESQKEQLIRLDEINERLFLLHSLRKKYGYTSQDIIAHHQEIKQNIDDLINYEDNILKLENELNAKRINSTSIAKKISNIRNKYAENLQNEVNKQLKDLYLENAEFKVDITPIELNNRGIDKVIFLLKANVGQNFISLEKTASLGETSRLNLALKTVFNKINQMETIIFDEIDIGVSGRVGNAISLKMKEISLNSQVIAISHLVQVASKADYQYLVSKYIKNNKTYSVINLLTKEERIKEIAKMMFGEITEISLKSAEDLLK